MLMQTYSRFPVTFVRGEGCRLYDENGKEYLDFSSGIGVNSVGHGHPEWVKAVSEQAAALAHTSNLFHTKPAARLAERLIAVSGLEGGSAFFSNSGAEANEGMLKLARKYSRDKYGEGRSVIATLTQSFHGRTVTTLSATGQDKMHKHFHPFTEGFVYVPAEDIDALKSLDCGVCAVMVEAVQGEGGVIPLSGGYLKELASLCEERDWLLMFDEIQTGIGRAGNWFAYQGAGVLPDVVSFAKGIGGGLPIGGFIANAKCAGVLGAGDHGSTFGGNPVCCAAALAVLDIVEKAMPDVEDKGERLREGLRKTEGLSNARGKGLMIGADVDEKTHGTPRKLVEKLLGAGIVCLTAGSSTLRLLPPLTISNEEIDKGLEIIKTVCRACSH